ncbi:hypothetical protein FXO38_03941 [Capsicum annuum]|nr:hypothetical protein FXO38_03941 [Capsicum annuum]
MGENLKLLKAQCHLRKKGFRSNGQEKEERSTEKSDVEAILQLILNHLESMGDNIRDMHQDMRACNIYIAKTSPPSVHEAYLDQFQKDFTTSLSMTCEEMVDFGSLVLTFICKIDEDDGCDFWELLGITTNDMVIEVTINHRARSRSCTHSPGMRWNCSSSPGANRTHSRRKLEPNSGKFLPGNAMEVLQHSRRSSVAEVKQKVGYGTRMFALPYDRLDAIILKGIGHSCFQWRLWMPYELVLRNVKNVCLQGKTCHKKLFRDDDSPFIADSMRGAQSDEAPIETVRSFTDRDPSA